MTWHSEALNEIAPALVAAQGALCAVAKASTAKVKTKSGAEFQYSYATLDDCWTMARPVLLANGLSLTQFPRRTDTGHLALLSILLHKSGQWLASEYQLPEAEGERMNAHQSEGSALTYARRYSLCAILGIPTEDDDGASASKPGARQSTRPQQAAAPSDGELPDAVPFGKNKGKPWSELAANSLDWYAKCDNPLAAAAAHREIERRNAPPPDMRFPDDYNDQIPF